MSMIDAIPLLAGAGADGGYQISRSVRLRSSASAYFSRTPASASNQTTWTLSMWVKRGSLSSALGLFNAGATATTAGFVEIDFQSDNTLIFYSQLVGTNVFVTTQVFRDPSAWYHLVFAVDTTQATASNRVKLYVNGVQVTSFSSTSYPAQNSSTAVNSTGRHVIGSSNTSGGGLTSYFDGYLTEINFIDGQALTPSSFGETNAVTGVWQPKRYAGTYGTNGFYLNFSDNSGVTATTIGKDYSGNGNNWTPNNISVTAGATYDSMLDVPTLYADGGNGRGNYCTLNPLATSTIYTTSKANLQVSGAATSSATHYCHGTLPVSTGKWYFEVTPTDVGGGPNIYVGVKLPNTSVNNVGAINTIQNGYGYGGDGNKISSGVVAYGATYTNNDVVGVALNLDAGTIVFYKNNVSQGTAFTGLTGEFVPVIAMSVGGTARTIAAEVNFGQRPFTYTPPTGFVALNTQNLPTPTISNGATVMAATLWTGNGTTQSISNAVNGVSFQPDFVWIKDRSAARSHILTDAVRGTTQQLYSNETTAEATDSNRLTAFNSNGFNVGTGLGVNASAETFVGWQWNAGGSTVTNTSGTISAQVRANPTAGFSIVTYTGTGSAATIGHGLGVAPQMILIFERSPGGDDHIVYHASLPSNQYSIRLNTTAAQAGPSGAYWNSTSPTSSVFSVGTSGESNQSTATYVAYCFAPIAGYSAFGSYTGNASADGPFVFCGFRPRFIMFKSTATGNNWLMFDTARNTFNLTQNKVAANAANAENDVAISSVSENNLDILSNGFKLRTTNAQNNGSGATIIFAAFAEVPFKSALGR